MRTIATTLTLTALLLSSCKKYVYLNFENDTIYDSVNVLTFRNNILLDSIWIKYNETADAFNTVKLNVDENDLQNLRFVNKTLNLSDSSTIDPALIKKSAAILISSSDLVVRRGKKVDTSIIKFDIAQRKFFANLYYY